MEPLVTIRRLLTWFCACPPDKKTSKYQKQIYTTLSLILFLSILSSAAASVAFFVEFVTTDFGQSLYAVFVLIGNATEINVIFVSLNYRQNIAGIFTQLSKMYKASKKNYRDNFTTLWKETHKITTHQKNQ